MFGTAEDIVRMSIFFFAIFGVLTNGALVYVIINATFSSMRTYSMILFLVTTASFLTAAASLAVQPSVSHANNTTIISFHGLCQMPFTDMVSKSKCCMFWHELQLHGVNFIQLLILISFVFRFTVLFVKSVRTISNIIIYSLFSIFTLGAVILFGVHYYWIWTSFDDIPNEIWPILGNNQSYYEVTNQSAYQLDVKSAWFYLPWLVLLFALSFRALIGEKIVRGDLANFERDHNERTANALTFQAVSSLFLVLSDLLYMYNKTFGLDNTPFYESLRFLPIAIITVINPLSIAFNIKPFREFINRCRNGYSSSYVVPVQSANFKTITQRF